MKRFSALLKGFTGIFVAGTLSVACIPVPAFAEAAQGAETDVQADAQSAVSPSDSAAIDDELIVTYKEDASIGKIVKSADVDTDGTQKLANDADGSDISLVSLDGSQDSAAVISALEDDPRVENVEHNQTIRALSTDVDDYFVRSYPRYSYYLQTEGIEDAWDSARANGKVTVAVLDSGVTMSSSYRDPDLVSTVDYTDAYDAIRGRKLSSGFKDTCGHGTAVAELIAAEANNGDGIAGVSYDAKVLPVRVIRSTGDGDLANLIAGYSHVLSVADKLNVRVINMSIGGEGEGSAASLQKLVNEAYSKGILSVAASGNEADDGNPVEYPAALDHVVSVGAVDSAGKVAPWSEHNKHVDLTAAGVDLCVPRFWNEVRTVIPFDPWLGLEFSTASNKNYTYTADTYVTESGTSFATPIVSGIAALLYAYDDSATAATVENALESSATDRGAKGRDEYYGYGEVNASAALAALPASRARVSAEKSTVAAFKASKTKASPKSRAKTAIKVGWTKLANASGYRVYYRAKGASNWKKTSTSKLSKTISKLKRKTSYQFRVRGYLDKLDGTKAWSAYSPMVTVKTK